MQCNAQPVYCSEQFMARCPLEQWRTACEAKQALVLCVRHVSNKCAEWGGLDARTRQAFHRPT